MTADEWRTHRERFEEASRHPLHREALARPAPTAPLLTGVVMPAVLVIAWLVIGWYLVDRFGGFDGSGSQFDASMQLAAVGILAVGAIVIGTPAVKTLRKSKAPIERTLAVVVDERTEVTSHGSRDHRRTETTYHATLQFADGERRELPTTSRLAGALTCGDIGLAVERGGDLIDFHRYPV